MKTNVDLLVVGGGINGVGIARDAAGRGLSVLLCEKDDLASHTSSASTKLIHGGLRYLEFYEFNLVRKALQEREVLLHAAPHIISPLRFVMPHVAHLRPAWMIRLGLFLYDNLSRRHILFGSRGIKFKSHISGRPLKDIFTKGFVYSDAWVDDARLVVANAISAHEFGATILTHTKLISAQPDQNGWQAELLDQHQQSIKIHARCLVNATGPWASTFLSQQIQTNGHGENSTPMQTSAMTALSPNLSPASGREGQNEPLRDIQVKEPHREVHLVKGSHIVTKKLFDHPYAYIFQNPDHRIIFAIPYLDDYTLIGTTDLEYKDDPDKVTITSEEISYLCDAINTYFKKAISPADVVWSYSGVRPLLEQEDAANPSSITRDYYLELSNNQAPLLSVFGGKITTFRRLAEEALNLLTPILNIRQSSWTSTAFLPGGDILSGDFNNFFTAFQKAFPWLPEPLAKRYAHNYGTRASQLLKGAISMKDLGEELSPGLFEQEVRYLVKHEWAQQVDDILWRRTKLGLMATEESQERLAKWLALERSAAS
jgi:glycerol-3-phosphate dehydrogenase